MQNLYTRAIGFWIVGAIFIFLGAMIAGSVEPYAYAATTGGVMISYIIAFVLILIGGMFWISAASYLAEEENEE